MMKVNIRADSVEITGYVNAVARESRVLRDKDGYFTETIKPGAFARALMRGKREMLLNHDKERVIGKEEEPGTQRGRDRPLRPSRRHRPRGDRESAKQRIARMELRISTVEAEQKRIRRDGTPRHRGHGADRSVDHGPTASSMLLRNERVHARRRRKRRCSHRVPGNGLREHRNDRGGEEGKRSMKPLISPNT